MPNKEIYPNRAYFDVTESAANTLTFSQVNTGIQAFSKIAWVVHSTEWYCGNRAELTGDGTRIRGAITTSNKMSDIELDDPAVHVYWELGSVVHGTLGGNEEVYRMPDIMDYSNMPGGGLIIPGYPLFIACKGTALVNPVHVTCRVLYTMVELADAEYIELVEALRMIE